VKGILSIRKLTTANLPLAYELAARDWFSLFPAGSSAMLY
jgi:hypothetical protein